MIFHLGDEVILVVKRINNMKSSQIAFGILALTLIACGGGTTQTGSISGLVLDTDGNPVRGARVYVDNSPIRETVSNSSGSFSLTGVVADNVNVRATIVKNSTTFYGENFAQVYANENSQSMNVVVMPISQVAAIQGGVSESTRGVRVQGARITAKPTSGSQFATVQTITDSNGNYYLNGLQSGVSYQVMASFSGFRSTDVARVPTAGVALVQNFTLQNSSDGVIPAPTNLSAVAWTSPSEVSRDRVAAAAQANIKKFIDARYKPSPTRVTANGNAVEVQLFWDKFDSLNILGYEVWRKRGSGDWSGIDFLRDPLSESYLDSDSELRENLAYTYAVAGGNSNYPNTDNSKGDFSATVSVTPLADMYVNNVSTGGGQVNFNWQAVNGASNYTVYVFSEYPGVRVTSYANNFNTPATGTSWTYNLTPLSSGQRYYYIVMGANSNDSARTLSAVGSFVAP
ncbi:MAG: carboxypeptidase-like regulatory domain-containing protein [Armatimonadota bacterium]